jgi:DNA repair protein RecO (recombination protein O)
MTLFNDEAFVITHSDWKETSLIIRCFTREHGKLNLMAKGIRRPKTRIGSPLESFSHVKIIYYLKQGKDLASLKEAYTLSHYPSIRMDLKRFAAVSFFFEILDIGLAPHERHSDVFDLTAGFLDSINDQNWENGSLPPCFFDLSKKLGFAPRLDSCLVCGTNRNLTHFDPGAGQCVCQTCKRNSEKIIPLPEKIMREMTTHANWMDRTLWRPDMLQDFFRFLRHFLEYHFEKRIKSGDFLISQISKD